MPERRMLAKSIIESDAFCTMPNEAQMLYVRLNMAADDDGFVSNPRTIMRAYGYGDDSMKLLIAKKFVIPFNRGDDFVFLIKHWKIHNYIQKDRYKASNFRELLRDVYLDENKAYSLTPGSDRNPALPSGIPGMDTGCIHPVSKMDTQVRKELGEDRGSVGESKNNFSLLSEKEEKEKEFSPPTEASFTPEGHAEDVAHCAKLVRSYLRFGWDLHGPYALAADRGVTRQEIDDELRRMEEKGETA